MAKAGLSSRKGKLWTLLLLVLALSVMVRLYFVLTWDQIPTSDPYHFVGWASAIGQAGRLDFPGSETRAFGQYPNGYPMLLQMLSATSGLSLIVLTKYLPLIMGSISVFPAYLFFGRFLKRVEIRIAATAMVVFSLAFLKYSSVSIPNMLGLFLFCLVAYLGLLADTERKRLTLVMVLAVLAVSRIHYLSFVAVGVALAIVLSRKLMVKASGSEFNPRRIAFLLILALVGGIAAWTAAYQVMLTLYGIDITQQPPPRLSIALSPAGYPLVFGVIQTLAVPLGLVWLFKRYYESHFREDKRELEFDPVLVFSLWIVFLVFASGFLKVEYYPFRFNCYLILPFALLSVLGLMLMRDSLDRLSYLSGYSWVVIPGAVTLVVIQPLAVSVVPIKNGEGFLPWKQEYGSTEIPALRYWMENTLLCVSENASGPKLPRREMIMADWVRSRALYAFGSDDVHIHWWFFQGWLDLAGRPFKFRSLDIYAGDINQSLSRLGRLYLGMATDGTGESYYYYNYIYASDWISEVMRADFDRGANFSKFDTYDGSLQYLESRANREEDMIVPRQKTYDSRYYAAHPLPPFDRIYTAPGVRIYHFPIGHPA